MKKNISQYLQILIATICCFSYFPSRAQKKSKQPNIIFVLVDDMGYGDIGVFYQNLRREQNSRSEPWFSTPNLDQMARNGAMLTNHYCAAPVCAPSRASLLSGLSQGQANVRDNQFDKELADNFTLGNILQKAGYSTAAIGKWGLQGKGEGKTWKGHPLYRGFDYYYGYIRHKDGHEHYPKEGIYRAKAEVWENFEEVSSGLDKCYTGDLWTAAAKKWIKEQTAQPKPFFLYLAYDLPHAVLELPTQAYPSGTGQKGGIQWIGKEGNMINTTNGMPDSWMDPEFEKATWDHDKDPETAELPWPDTYKRYATIIGRIDRQMGDLLALLKDLHLDENTLVVFTSDNGPSMESYLPKGSHPNNPDFFNSFGPFDGIKRDLWEGGIRVPTIVWWPEKVAAGLQVSAPSAFQDWASTLANVAGFPSPAFSDGNSILPLLDNKGLAGKREVYIEYFENGKTPGYADFDPSHRQRVRKQMQMLRRDDTVAIRYNIQSGSDDFEMYDVQKDPKQVNNLALNISGQDLQNFYKRRVLELHRPDTSATRPYDVMLMPSVEVEEKEKEGLKWRVYRNAAPWLSDIKNLSPVKSGIWNFSTSMNKVLEEDGLIYSEGYFYADYNGEYSFDLKTAVPLIMKLHDVNLFNQDYSFDKNQTYTQTILLEKGWHPIRIYFRNKGLKTFPFQLTYIHSQMPESLPWFKADFK